MAGLTWGAAALFARLFALSGLGYLVRLAGVRRCVALLPLVVVLLAASFGAARSSDAASSTVAGQKAVLVHPSATSLIVGSAIKLPQALFTANPAGSTSLIAPSQARAVATAMWAAWEQALIRANTQALSQLVERGPYLSALVDACAVSGTGCVYEKTPRPIKATRLIVPLQTHYPIYFMAETQTTQYLPDANGLVGPPQPWVELQILTKASAQDSWKLAFDTGYNLLGNVSVGNAFIEPDLSPGPGPSAGTIEQYNGSAQRKKPPVPASRFLLVVAAYWQSFKDTGHAPTTSLFINGQHASTAGKELASARQGATANGYQRHFKISANLSAGEWTFSVGGYPLVCGSIVNTETDTSPGGTLEQSSDEKAWGPPLPPGNYLQIVQAHDHETCVFVVDPDHLDVLGGVIQTSNITGKPASQVLVDVETDYGVLVTQFHTYEARFLACATKDPTASNCTTSFRQDAARQFGHFYTELTGSERFPTVVRPQAARLAATARKLALLCGTLPTASPTTIFKKLLPAEKTLDRQYLALVRGLS